MLDGPMGGHFAQTALNMGLATGNMDEYKAVSYNICRAVEQAKWCHRR